MLLGGVGESLRGGILSLTLSRPLASANPLILWKSIAAKKQRQINIYYQRAFLRLWLPYPQIVLGAHSWNRSRCSLSIAAPLSIVYPAKHAVKK